MYEILVPVDRHEERGDAQVAAILGAPYDVAELRASVLQVVEVVDLPGTVSTVADGLRAAGIETAVHSTRGAPTDAILAIVEATDADAVVIGCRRRTPVGKVVFGSVAQEVIRRADCPITVTPR